MMTKIEFLALELWGSLGVPQLSQRPKWKRKMKIEKNVLKNEYAVPVSKKHIVTQPRKA